MALMRVRYKGLSDIREMSVNDLAAAGVAVKSDLRWDNNNRRTIYIDSPTDDLLELFAKEGAFQVEEVDGNGVVKPDTAPVVEHDALKLDDTGLTVIDGGTGQVSVKPVDAGNKPGKP